MQIPGEGNLLVVVVLHVSLPSQPSLESFFCHFSLDSDLNSNTQFDFRLYTSGAHTSESDNTQDGCSTKESFFFKLQFYFIESLVTFDCTKGMQRSESATRHKGTCC